MFNIVSGHNMIKQMILLWKTGRQKHYFERKNLEKLVLGLEKSGSLSENMD